MLLLCALAGEWSCAEPNPSYYAGGHRDASTNGDVSRLPDATSDGLVDGVPSSVEPPDVSPRDALVESDADAPDAEARPVDAGIESQSDIARDTSNEDTDIVQQSALLLNKLVYNIGEEIIASFSNGPGNAGDWIGIYDESAPTPSDDNRSLLWYYTDNRGWETRPPGPGPRNGTVTFGPGSRGSRQWPLSAGRYLAIFLSSPHIQLTAPVHFQVR